MLEALKAELGLTYIFISHDLGLVRYFCDRIVVMYLGSIVEELPDPTQRAAASLYPRPAGQQFRARSRASQGGCAAGWRNCLALQLAEGLRIRSALSPFIRTLRRRNPFFGDRAGWAPCRLFSSPLIPEVTMSHHVLTAEFIHESNTFKMGLTQLRAFEVDLLKEGDVAIAERGDAPTELAGFLDGAREAGWKVSHVISAHAEPGSKVSREAFDYVADRICAAVEAKKETLDGILLGLHGAMVTEFCEDGEGELLKRIRAIVGDKMPIAITLDLHANATPDMVRDADIIVSYKTYPHVDMRLAGRQAARHSGKRHGRNHPAGDASRPSPHAG